MLDIWDTTPETLLCRHSWSWYPKPSQDVFKVNGPIWAFHENRLGDTQNIMVAVFYSHYHNLDTLKPPKTHFENDWANLSFSEKITCRTSRVHLRWFWCSKSSSGGVKPDLGHKLSILMEFEKKSSTYTLKGTL